MENNIYNFHIITIFPYLFNNFLDISFIKKSQINKKINFFIYNLRDFSKDKHKKVDDRPFGGGPGMILKPEPIFDAINFIKEKIKTISKTILLTPQGKLFTQKKAIELVNDKKVRNLILICGRYEGIDERVLTIIDEEISIGNFVLNGGEIPAMVIIETMVRLFPSILGNSNSKIEDSFYQNNLLDYPQYTRPYIYKNLKVPDILLTGNHKKISEWRKEQTILNTRKKRPELLKGDN